jgi:hypothetical protein
MGIATPPLHARAARRMAAGAVSHVGPAVRGTAIVLWRALGEAGAMCLVTPPPEAKRSTPWGGESTSSREGTRSHQAA